jgi:hypothetical protein
VSAITARPALWGAENAIIAGSAHVVAGAGQRW